MPLRERKEDIPDLIESFLLKTGNQEKHFSKDALRFSVDYPWPGNIRQLEKVVTVLGELSENNEIGVKALENQLAPIDFQTGTATLQNSKPLFSLSASQAAEGFQTNINRFEQAIIRFALNNTENHSQAAKLLSIPRNSLIRRVKEWGWINTDN